MSARRLPKELHDAIAPQLEVSRQFRDLITEMRTKGIKDELILRALIGITNSLQNRRIDENAREHYVD